jgi:flagellar hook-associated protein 2
LTVTRDGTLSLDESKLNAAFTSDPKSVEALLGRAAGATSGGAMATLKDLLVPMTAAGTGTIATRSTVLSERASRLDKRAGEEQTRLDRYADQLRKQFTQMEQAYSQSQSLLAQVSRLDTIG